MMQNNQQKFLLYAVIGAFVLIGILSARIYAPNLFAISGVSSGSLNFVAIFLTGLITGGLTCMAVQGGLLAATLAQQEEERLQEKAIRFASFGRAQDKSSGQDGGNALPILAFLTTKLVAYTILGFLLGWLGSFFKLSITTNAVLQIAVAVFMVGTALSILDVHPIFRYFVIQPPKFLTRLVRKQSKSKDMFAPAILGAFTIFIPCGTTQAMMALAVASGKPLLGAVTLFAFILGTSPIFFVLGYFATKLGDMFQQKFMKLAAIAIILLAVFNVNNAAALLGSPITLNSLFGGFSNTSTTLRVGTAVQNPTVEITASGYTPNNVTVKAGSNVTLHLTNTGGQGCTQSFTIPSLGIQKVVPMGNSDVIAFTAPNQPGQIPFMCSMGMYRGVINVI